MKLFACAALAVVALAGCAPDEIPTTASAVEERLTCQCGCGLTVHTCNHMQCSFGVPVKKDVADSLAAGQTGEQIISRYVAQYGEKILSSPTRHGFNLLAWYGPYAALLVSAAVLLLMLRRWQSAGPKAMARDQRGAPLSQSERDRLERELDELGR
jgi:cytochrome c-type biogenesis protein CcmH/NrfF